MAVSASSPGAHIYIYTVLFTEYPLISRFSTRQTRSAGITHVCEGKLFLGPLRGRLASYFVCVRPRTRSYCRIVCRMSVVLPASSRMKRIDMGVNLDHELRDMHSMC